MENLTYRLDQFEGPLDLLLTLIRKNKVNIEDIPISLICDQYMETIREAERMDLDVAGEFIVMASELMLIKSKMLLPRASEDEEDPRKGLSDALLRYEQAKEAGAKMLPLYSFFSGRMVKDTDEITVDRSFVADQSPDALFLAMKRILDFNRAMETATQTAFSPMIRKPVVPVEEKIVRILDRLGKKPVLSLGSLIDDAVSLPDMIAIFIGVLELVKIRRILIDEDENDVAETHGIETRFRLNDNYVPPENGEDKSDAT